MQEGHGPGRDAALEPVAHDQLCAGAQLVQQQVQALEIVGVVGVAHDDETATRGADPAHQGGAIAAIEHADHARAFRFGQSLGPIGRSVVGDQHLAGHAGAAQEAERLAHTDLHGLGFVQTGHQDGELELSRAHGRSRHTPFVFADRHGHDSLG